MTKPVPRARETPHKLIDSAVLNDPKARQKVVNALRAGLALSVAGSLVGISREAIKRRRRHDPEFDAACSRAVAEYEESLLGAVNAGTDDPRLALEVLSRRFPKRWSQRLEMRTTDEDDDRNEDDAAELSDEELLELAAGGKQR